MGREFKFEGTITFCDDREAPDEEFMDLSAFYYGDKHQDFVINVTNGTIEEVKK